MDTYLALEPYTIFYDPNTDVEGATDCDCACTQSLPPALSPPVDACPRLTVHEQLSSIPLDDEYAVLFVPSLSRLAVANGPTRALIDRLRHQQDLDALDEQARAAALSLWQLGLLRAEGEPEVAPAPADELVAWLHTTNACNLRCTYCYVEKTDEAMSQATADEALAAIFRSARRHGYKRLLLKYAGGEASLNLPLVAYLHQQAAELAAADGITLRGVILSNGVALTTRRLEQIKALGLRLMISLDGPAEAHDAQRPTVNGQPTHAAVLASIERARRLGLNLIISVTVTGESVGGLPEVLRWLLARQLRFSINFYRENDRSVSFSALKLDEQRLISGMLAAYAAVEEDLPAHSLLGALLDRTNLGGSHDRACAVGENYLVIDQRGGITRCQMTLAEPLTTVHAPDPLEVIRLDPRGVQNLPVAQKPACRSCEWRYWCSGGCPVATLRATGRTDVQSPNCAIYKALFPHVLRLEGMRLLRYRLSGAGQTPVSPSQA